MREIDLDGATAEQIVDAIFELDAEKFILIMHVLSHRVEQLQRRGKKIADRKAEDDFRKFLEGGEQ